ncbi:prolipoprotein diacylglyceryl transferase [Sneathiella sp.]|uniref:prolipoprotein diacylglyceryl transferase n=1 Tax=Sneathiella sp. TaxID=1964365 RepID=UPI003564B760
MTLSTQFLAISFPEIDPIIFQIGPFAIRWYALAYIAGLVIGWRLMMWLARKPGSNVTDKQVDDFLIWATLGVILGGRLGYVLFYKPAYFLANPMEIFMVWHGGMSFHGGILGVTIATIIYTRILKISLMSFADLLAIVTPIGLFFGRLANFINGELYGRPTDVAWAVIFPGGGDMPRHPSQIYEALCEGALLFVIMLVMRKTRFAEKPGFLAGIFLVGYALARSFVELFRQPDAYLGFLIGGFTMGQLLSLPMIVIGLWLICRATPAKA